MAKTRPQSGPGEPPESGFSAAASGESRPSEPPPGGVVSAAAKGDCGCGGGAGSGMMMAGSASLPPGAGDAAPSIRPPEGVGGGITAWLSNKRITGLWTINQNRNSWVAVDGVGWKKLANNSDSAIVALTLLGSHAREKNSVVNYRDEADGMIHEMYVW